MIKAFQIYKEGITNGWVTILIPEEFFNDEHLEYKMNFYYNLGYSVKPI